MDAAVDEVERDGMGPHQKRNSNQPLVWKCWLWWDSHLYAAAATIIFTFCKKMCGVQHTTKRIRRQAGVEPAGAASMVEYGRGKDA